MTNDDPTSDPRQPSGNAAANPFASPRAVERQRDDLPRLPADHRPFSLFAKLGIVLVTMFASIIAFCCTCFSIGLLTAPIEPLAPIGFVFASVAGMVAAVVVGRIVLRVFTGHDQNS